MVASRPSLILSVTGGAGEFELAPHLKKAVKGGLQRVGWCGVVYPCDAEQVLRPFDPRQLGLQPVAQTSG